MSPRLPSVRKRLEVALHPHYALERELGRGGMATVYLARDRKHERAVAIKVLKPELAAAVGSRRFEREIEVVARLRHPHILPLHDSRPAGRRGGYGGLRGRLRTLGVVPVRARIVSRQGTDPDARCRP